MANFVCPDKNFQGLSPNGFQLIINKSPSLSYYAQNVSIPDISLPSANMPNPFSTIKEPGDIMDFSDLTVEFLVDSEMKNYLEIFHWIYGLGFPTNYSDYTDFIKTQSTTLAYTEYQSAVSDGYVIVYGNDNKPIRKIKFVDLLPTNLSNLNFTTTSNGVQYLTATAIFNYSHFYFEI